MGRLADINRQFGPLPTAGTAGALQRALGLGPPAGTSGAQNAYYGGGVMANPLPRPPELFTGGTFAPGAPVVPMPAQPPPEGADRPLARRRQYLPNINYPSGTPGTEANQRILSFDTCRMWYDKYSVVTACVDLRVSELLGLGWDLKPSPLAMRAIHTDRQARQDWQERAQQVRTFFQRPDPNYDSDVSWATVMYQDLYTVDGACLQLRGARTKGKGVLGTNIAALDYIAPDTIKPIIDVLGGVPLPPNTAYQQYLWGVPRAEFIRPIDEEEDPDVIRKFSRDQLLYLMLNPQSIPIYGRCYDSETEVLTRRGWLRFDEVAFADEIATRNPETKAFEWQRPDALLYRDYDGPMFSLKSRSLDLLVTPEHRVLLDSLPSGIGPQRTRGKGGEVVVTAQEIAAAGHNGMNKIPMTSTWEGVEVPAHVFRDARPRVLREITRRVANGVSTTYLRHDPPNRTVAITGDDYCSLMGAYLAEGNVRAAGGIEIAQRVTSKGYEAYSVLCARIGGKAQHNGKAFVLPLRALTDHFRQFGHAADKYVPDEIMDAPQRQLRLFWDHYVLGDGNRQHVTSASGRGRHPRVRDSITTTSRRMAGQLQEIAQKLGWSASVRRRPGGSGGGLIEGRLIKGRRDSYVISVRYSRASAFSIEETTYRGKIGCVTVPNGIIYVRRNGKPAWCGNSGIEKAVVPIMTGLKYQEFQLGWFREGSVPDTFIIVGDPDMPTTVRENLEMALNQTGADLGNKLKIRVLPANTKVEPMRQTELADQNLLNVLYEQVLMCFDIRPSEFELAMKHSNNQPVIGSAQEAMTKADTKRRALVKDAQKLKRNLYDRVIHDFLGQEDIDWTWPGLESQEDFDARMATVIALGDGGYFTHDEVRLEAGKDPLGTDETTQLMVKTNSGVVPLAVTAAAGVAALNAAQNPTPSPAAPQHPVPPPTASGATSAESVAEDAREDAQATASAARAAMSPENTDDPTDESVEQKASSAGTGAMVALFVPPDVAQQLAQHGTEPANQLHVTLAFLSPDVAKEPPFTAEKVTEAMRSLASRSRPLAGRIGGVARFHNPDSDVAVALPNVPGLAELRDDVIEALRGAGVEQASEHGWTPHITLAYADTIEPAALPSLPGDIALTFGALSVCWGAQRWDFEFGPGPQGGGQTETTEKVRVRLDDLGRAQLAELTQLRQKLRRGQLPAWTAKALDQETVDSILERVRDGHHFDAVITKARTHVAAGHHSRARTGHLAPVETAIATGLAKGLRGVQQRTATPAEFATAQVDQLRAQYTAAAQAGQQQGQDDWGTDGTTPTQNVTPDPGGTAAGLTVPLLALAGMAVANGPDWAVADADIAPYLGPAVSEYEMGYASAVPQGYEIRWDTQEDRKVCPVCTSRDGKTYTLETLPNWPGDGAAGGDPPCGWYCRCGTTWVAT